MNKILYYVIVSCLVVIVVIIIAILILYFRISTTKISQKTNNSHDSNYQDSDILPNDTVKQISTLEEILLDAKNFYKAELKNMLNLTEDQYDQLIITTYLASQCDPRMILEVVKDSIATNITKKHDKMIIKEIKRQQLEQLKALKTTDMKTQNKLWKLPSIVSFAERIQLSHPYILPSRNFFNSMVKFAEDCTQKYPENKKLLTTRRKNDFRFVYIAFFNINAWCHSVIRDTISSIKIK